MGLHFIFGAAGTGKTRRCCEEIRDYVTGKKGRSAFFLVPDQETYTAERMLADIFPGHGFIDAAVCGFSASNASSAYLIAMNMFLAY